MGVFSGCGGRWLVFARAVGSVWAVVVGARGIAVRGGGADAGRSDSVKALLFFFRSFFGSHGS